MSYYEEGELERFSEIGKHRPDLFEKFMAWYQACQEEGALSRREKALIGLAVAHALQCPYCIDAFWQSCLEAGSNMEQMTEAIHMASATANHHRFRSRKVCSPAHYDRSALFRLHSRRGIELWRGSGELINI